MGHLKHVTARIDSDLFDALQEYAAQHHSKSVSMAIKELLQVALQSEGQLAGLGQLSLKNRGYTDGLRRGLHEARVAISGALSNLWP